MPARPPAAPSLFRSLTAGLACALVLGLGLLAHAPRAHAWLHSVACAAGLPHTHDHTAPTPSPDSGAHDADHHCAITAFAHGADSPAPALLVTAPLSVSAPAPLPEAKTLPGRAAYLLPPGRAPPAA